MRGGGLERDLIEGEVYERAIARFRTASIALPALSELADPSTIPATIHAALVDVGPDDPHPLNLFRVHWYNGADRRSAVEVPEHVVLPPELTGVDARIVVALGDRFPMIGAHKVLAAYGCLAPRVVTGRFDPTRDRAVWPSTGNYCRGGVAISRLMDCRGVAVLPEGMSRERFDWLEQWVTDPSDIIRTPGTESNVKEIYDRCAQLATESDTVILNQFAEFGNHIIHRLCTGRALERVFETLREQEPSLTLRAFVSASGSAGTLGAGNHLRERFGSLTVAVEALECPTLLYNGFGEHNIQGIGDKHVPLIHDVMATDVVTAVSDRTTDRLFVLFNTDEGRAYLRDRRGVKPEVLDALRSFGLSSICNVVAAIKLAKRLRLGSDDAIATVATDGAAMYASELERLVPKHFSGGFDAVTAGETFGEHVLGTTDDHLLECTDRDRRRILDLGYYTWVEQRGVSVEDFESRAERSFWDGLADLVPAWDALIREFNERTGVREALV
jgi:cysteine synthase A